MYGEENVSFNVHNLLHLPKDCQKYGPLESFSAFSFENHISSIKKFIRKSEKPLEQIARRISECETLEILCNEAKKNTKIEVDNVHSNGIVLDNFKYESQYKVLSTSVCKIDITDERNSCVMVKDGNIVKICNVVKRDDNIYIIGKRYNHCEDLYVISGCQSSMLGIQIAKNLRSNFEEWSCTNVACKMFIIPCTEGHIVLPIIHSFESFS